VSDSVFWFALMMGMGALGYVIGSLDRHMTTTDLHEPGPRCPRPECSTFDGWIAYHCYACGGDLRAPRVLRRQEEPRPGLANPTSHRWCFE
jgi:hypothetical protein